MHELKFSNGMIFLDDKELKWIKRIETKSNALSNKTLLTLEMLVNFNSPADVSKNRLRPARQSVLRRRVKSYRF